MSKILNEKLICDVMLPPATIIKRGCDLRTLLVAINQRGNLPPAQRVLREAALAQQPTPAAPDGFLLVTPEQVERHATTAWECPPQSRVVLVSSLKRLHTKNAAPPAAEQLDHSGDSADMVWCACGDGYPADTYDAGFIHGSGMCQNCDAAIPAKDIQADADDLVVWRITLPSGESCHFGTESMAKAWGRGSGKVERIDLKARPALELVAAEQPDTVKVPRELLAELRAFTLEYDSGRAGVMRGHIDALLGKEGE